MTSSGNGVIDVSVIIPTYNRLWSLPETIESCRHDSCRTEIIVVDDGSTDGTWDWLQAQPDVRSFRQENAGKDWAVNKAFAESRGEFVRFLDSDDMLAAGANDCQLQAARSASADVVAAGYILLDQIAKTQKAMPWEHCDDFIAQQLGECSSSHYSAYLFRRDFIADVPHRQEFGVRDDRMFIIEVALKKPSLVTVDMPTFVHRHHAQERLQFQKGLAAAATNYAHWQIYRRAARVLGARDEFTLRRRRAICNAIWPLAHWIGYSHRADACELAKWIHELDPAFVPPESGALGFLYRNLGFRSTEMILKLRRVIVTAPRIKLRRMFQRGEQAKTCRQE